MKKKKKNNFWTHLMCESWTTKSRLNGRANQTYNNK